MKILNEAGLSHFWTKLKEKFVAKTDIVDNLTSTDTNKALSAKQGKVLNDTKFNISGGKVEGTIEAGGTPSIKNLYDFGATSILGGSNDSKGGEIDLNGCLHPANPGGVTITAKDNDAHESSVSLKADGTFTKDSKKILTEDDIIDNLTSTDTDKALSAKQGKILNDNKLDITGGQVEGTLELGGMPTIKGLYDDRTMSIYGSNNSFKGGKISINGHLTTMKPGSITFMAKDNDDNSSSVSLDADGTFTKDNKKILTEDDIDNNLTSTSTNKALSSYQGKILNESKISHYSTMPEASVDFLGQTVQYTGVNTSTAPFYVHNFFYECKESTVTAGTYEWLQISVQPSGTSQVDNSSIGFNTSGELEVKNGGITLSKFAGQSTADVGKVPGVKSDGTWELIAPDLNSLKQYTTMPTASVDYYNKIVQYTGTTTSTYTCGSFYRCVLNGSSYEWENFSPGSGEYVKKSGDTMTGALRVSTIKGMRDDLCVNIQGGGLGASCNLYSDAMGGNFKIVAEQGSNNAVLEGKPDGTLTWDGEPIPTLQAIYDIVHPVGEKLICLSMPVLPRGVTASWNDITSSYNGRYFKVSSTAALGTLEAEQLPNIKGSLTDGLDGWFLGNPESYQHSGALSAFCNTSTSSNTDRSDGGGKGNRLRQIEFNAHDSNSVYTDGGAVKPLTVTVKVYQRVA